MAFARNVDEAAEREKERYVVWKGSLACRAKLRHYLSGRACHREGERVLPFLSAVLERKIHVVQFCSL